MDIEVDEDGWAAIHHCVAAEKELLMSIEKFINMNADTLEFETQDRDRRTPLLLATHCNKKKSVEKLLDLGMIWSSVMSRVLQDLILTKQTLGNPNLKREQLCVCV